MVYDPELKKQFRSEHSREKYYRILAHNKFDIIRKYKKEFRIGPSRLAMFNTYKELAEYMGKDLYKTHMKLFGVEECKQVLKFSKRRWKEEVRKYRIHLPLTK